MACPNFKEKTFTDGSKAMKFENVLSLESFPLYGTCIACSLLGTVLLILYKVCVALGPFNPHCVRNGMQLYSCVMYVDEGCKTPAIYTFQIL